jgi:hypothetical protein
VNTPVDITHIGGTCAPHALLRQVVVRRPGERTGADDHLAGPVPDATIIDLTLGEACAAALTVLGGTRSRSPSEDADRLLGSAAIYEDDSYLNERRTFVR